MLRSVGGTKTNDCVGVFVCVTATVDIKNELQGHSNQRRKKIQPLQEEDKKE